MSRNRKAPVRFGDWEEDLSRITEKKEKVKEKLWQVEDVLERRGEGRNEEVLVKWSKWDGPNTWVELEFNRELQQYLTENRANPDSCTLHKVALQNVTHSVDSDILALRQAIFDSLSEARYTPDGRIGRQNRVTIKLPFRKEVFDSHFRSFGLEKIPPDNGGNVNCHITGEELTQAIGEGWESRCYQTSTETFVTFKEYIHLSWGYKERIQYDHSSCRRCHWSGEESLRPQMCESVETNLPGPPWISLTFTRGRRNMVTGDISKRRK